MGICAHANGCARYCMGIHTGHIYSLLVYASVHTYTSIHVRIFIHTQAHVCARAGAVGGGQKKSPPIAPLSSLYRCGRAYPIPLVFLTFGFIPSLLIFHILFYTHTLISKNSERSLVQSTIPIHLHSLQHSPIVQLIRNAACITRTRRASQRDTDRSVQDSRATPGHDRQYSVVINVNKCQAGRRKSYKPVCRMVLQS